MVTPAPVSAVGRPRSTTADEPGSDGHHVVAALPSISFAAEAGWTLPPSARLTAGPSSARAAGAAPNTARVAADAARHSLRCRKSSPPVIAHYACESERVARNCQMENRRSDRVARGLERGRSDEVQKGSEVNFTSIKARRAGAAAGVLALAAGGTALLAHAAPAGSKAAAGGLSLSPTLIETTAKP